MDLGLILLAMDELASLTIWAVAILHILLAKFGLVEDRYITLSHDLLLSMSEGALVSIFAMAGLLEVLAHLSPEFVHIWG